MRVSKISELDAIAWHASESCRERAKHISPVLAFLKPASPEGSGPTPDLVLGALKEFGFTVNVIGTEVFDAITLRVMWRNLRDWSAWIKNAKAYEGVPCPIVEVLLPDRDVLNQLDFFKQTLRSLAISPSEHVYNCLHAPTTPFEAALHGDILAGKVDLPRMNTAQLAKAREQVTEFGSRREVETTFSAVGCMLEDDPSALLHDGALGLCIVEVESTGAVLAWRDHAGRPVSTSNNVNWVCRWLENATFVGGSADAFLRCLRHYQVRFLQTCREAQSPASIIQSNGEPRSEASHFVRRRVPPPIQPGLVARAEHQALRQLGCA